jgi:prevent-host-death family protein
MCYYGHKTMVIKRRKAHQSPKTSRVRESAPAYEIESTTARGIAREIGAGEFKARCLAIMDELKHHGGEYVITKRGVPVARLLPVRVEPRPLLGSMKGTATTRGDIVSPLDEPWETLQGRDDER